MPREYRINNRIFAREALVITETGDRLGVLPVRQALNLAQERGLDLVEVAPDAQPPVCRLLDYGKFRYEQAKKEKEARKGQHIADIGEIRLRPKIGAHDIDFKTRQVRKLIEGGDKVKVSVMFRGREATHPELAVNLLRRVAESVQDIAGIDTPPQAEARGLSMVLAPGRQGKKKVTIESATDGKVQAQDAQRNTEAGRPVGVRQAAAGQGTPEPPAA